MILGLVMSALGALHQVVEQLSGRWTSLSAFLEMHFGIVGRFALWIAASLLVLMLAVYATRLTFRILRVVLLPSAAMCVALLMLAPQWSPMRTLPILMGATTLLMVVRSR